MSVLPFRAFGEMCLPFRAGLVLKVAALILAGSTFAATAQSFTHSWSTYWAHGNRHNAVTVRNTGNRTINCNVLIVYTAFGVNTAYQQSLNTHTGLIRPGESRQSGGVRAPVSRYEVRCWYR